MAAPAIQAGLGAGPGAVQLVLSGYTLTYACLLIPAARLGDRYGYRRLFVAGTVVFTAGSLAGACAPDTASLIIARLVQGAGSGLVAPPWPLMSAVTVRGPASPVSGSAAWTLSPILTSLISFLVPSAMRTGVSAVKLLKARQLPVRPAPLVARTRFRASPACPSTHPIRAALATSPHLTLRPDSLCSAQLMPPSIAPLTAQAAIMGLLPVGSA
ncbi:MFS transporter [Streptomyces sp. NPDC058369]|uniref:MFS transporter n=1 Tax=Streptomyces sp. NPDC058369 TaxID=3346462 RepID=UPI0036634FA6